jgi:hypothetical protein
LIQELVSASTKRVTKSLRVRRSLCAAIKIAASKKIKSERERDKKFKSY